MSESEYKSVCILSDSQNAISAIKQCKCSHPIVFKIKKLIKSLENNISFHIKWIKGHTGIPGNERVDNLSKEASLKNINESVYNLFPLSFAKRHFHSVTVNEWQNEWQNEWHKTENSSRTKLFFPTISDRLSVGYLKPNFVLTQFISGNGNFNLYLNRFKISDNSMCDCEQSIVTPN